VIPGITAQPSVGFGGVGPPPYAAHGVRFDNSNSSINNYLDVASMTQADASQVTASFWAKTDNVANFPTFFSCGFFYIMVGFNHTTDVYAHLADNGSNSFAVGSANGKWTNNVWHHIFFSAQTNHAAGSKLGNLYLDGVNIFSAPDSDDTSASFTAAFHSKELGIPATTSTINLEQNVADFADLWIAPGVYLDATNIPLFRSSSGKPVNLGVNGQTPTGTRPAFFFTGTATSFIANSGSGDSVTLHGNATDVSGPP
jgi:hypothetical protein